MPSQTPNSKFWSQVEAIGGRKIQPHDQRSILKLYGWTTLKAALPRWAEYCAGDGSTSEFRRLCSEIEDERFNAPASERRGEPAIRALDVPVLTHEMAPMPWVKDSLVKEMPPLIQALVASRLEDTGICVDYGIAAALSVIAGVTGNRVRFKAWGDLHFTNAYYCLVGATGKSYKSSVLKWVKQMLSEADAGALAADEGSVEALIADLAERPSRVWIRDEFSGLLAAIKGTDYLRPVRELLLSLYDHTGVYKRRLMRRSYEATDPCLTFLTTIQPAVMGEELFQGRNIDSGFVNRLLLICGEGVDPYWPRIEGAGGYAQSIRIKLAAMARQPRVTIDAHDCLSIAQQWDGKETEVFGPYGKWVATRASIQALKIAVLFEAAAGAERSVLSKDWIHLAIALLERWYKAACTSIAEVHIKQPGERDRRDFFSLICHHTHNETGPVPLGQIAAEAQVSSRQAETWTEDLQGRGWVRRDDQDDPACIEESALCERVAKGAQA